MSATPLLTRPAHDQLDPLSTGVERLPLACPRFGEANYCEPASTEGLRPFGLRFAVPPTGRVEGLPPWRYCPERQIALTPDGQQWHRSLADMTMRTTGPSPDGGGSTGNEEWTPDFAPDEPTVPA